MISGTFLLLLLAAIAIIGLAVLGMALGVMTTGPLPARVLRWCGSAARGWPLAQLRGLPQPKAAVPL